MKESSSRPAPAAECAAPEETDSPGYERAGANRWPGGAFARATDRLTGALGRLVSWLVLAMVLIGAYNAVVRYLGRFTGANLSSNLYLELQWYLFSLVFLLGAGYALKENAHVRVDVLYGRLGRRARAWIDGAGAALMLLPFCVFLLWVSWPSVHNSWTIREVSPDPGGLPRYPLKAVIIVCFVLLMAQGLAQLAKDGSVLRRRPAAHGSNGDDGGGDAKRAGARGGRASAENAHAPLQRPRGRRFPDGCGQGADGGDGGDGGARKRGRNGGSGDGVGP